MSHYRRSRPRRRRARTPPSPWRGARRATPPSAPALPPWSTTTIPQRQVANQFNHQSICAARTNWKYACVSRMRTEQRRRIWASSLAAAWRRRRRRRRGHGRDGWLWQWWWWSRRQPWPARRGRSLCFVWSLLPALPPVCVGRRIFCCCGGRRLCGSRRRGRAGDAWWSNFLYLHF